uniref:Uncharacterized protein n=1 Tax=Avena sativa TaxID=4498 RepID=A0ACD5XBA7_AVESA
MLCSRTESSSQLATMAEAAGAAVPAPLHRGLPDEIVVWEILVRLPRKAILRCRAVCPAWRRATSTRDFLLAHHGRQPTFPLFYAYEKGDEGRNTILDIIPLGHRAALTTDDQLPPAARLGTAFFYMEASCDGLLVLSMNYRRFCICNPATRQYAPLPLLHDFSILGMYLHSPTGRYRLLLNKLTDLIQHEDLPTAEYPCHVFTIGSGELPRRIGCPDAETLLIYTRVSLMLHGSLHWSKGQMIIVFDTTAESFRQMHPPIVSGDHDLFEIDGKLGMYSLNDEATIMAIWVMQDYQGEVWAFKHRVELPVAEVTAQFEEFDNHLNIVVESLDGDMLVLVRFGNYLLQVDINGKLVASFHRRCRRCLGLTQLRLKQTLVSHSFFPTLEGYVVNASPFI